MTQVLVGYDMDEQYNGIHVTIENSSSEVETVAKEQVIRGASLDIKTIIPVSMPETAKNIDLGKVNPLRHNLRRDGSVSRAAV